jgi:hypothetical protein
MIAELFTVQRPDQLVEITEALIPESIPDESLDIAK